MIRCFKYRIYPKTHQIIQFDRWLEICRELYNAALEERSQAWKLHRTSISYGMQSAQLPQIKEIREDVKEVNAQVLQQALRRLDHAFENFFRRIKRGETPGYPRFRGTDRFNSLTWPQATRFCLNGNRLSISKFGDIKIKIYRPIEGKPKTVTVKREAGKWYAIFSCDEVPARAYPIATFEVGVDVGLESFATLSDGSRIDNPRWYRKAEEKIKSAQRKLTSKKKRSKRRAKAKARIARLHFKAANQRLDFHHKLSKKIVFENRLIAVEDLSIKKMVEKSSAGLSKSIHDAGWSNFLSLLAAKAEEAGRQFVRVDPAGTSATCSRCGHSERKALSERTHCCKACGVVIDRDVNAAINILRLGRSLRETA